MVITAQPCKALRVCWVPRTHSTVTPQGKARLPPAQARKYRSPCSLFPHVTEEPGSAVWPRSQAACSLPPFPSPRPQIPIKPQTTQQPRTLRESGFPGRTSSGPRGVAHPPAPVPCPRQGCCWRRGPSPPGQAARGAAGGGPAGRATAGPRHGSAAAGSQSAPEPGPARLHSFIHKKEALGAAPFRAPPALTAIRLVAVIRAVVVLVAFPDGGDAALVPALELVLLALLDAACETRGRAWVSGESSATGSIPGPLRHRAGPRGPAGVGAGTGLARAERLGASSGSTAEPLCARMEGAVPELPRVNLEARDDRGMVESRTRKTKKN